MKNFYAGYPVSRDYRKMAQTICKPQMNNLVVIYFLLSIILFVGAVMSILFFAVGGLIVYYLCACALSMSLIYVAKNVATNVEVKAENLLHGFNYFGKSIGIFLLTALYRFLWCLVPIVGPIISIVKTYSYSMALYVALDKPELSCNECITESRYIMDGYKWRLFCLNFSYIGWFILANCTFGILYLWVLPRMQQAYYLLYLKASGIGYKLEVEKETAALQTV